MWKKFAPLAAPLVALLIASCAVAPAVRPVQADAVTATPAAAPAMVTGSRVPQPQVNDSAHAATNYPVQTVTGDALRQSGRGNTAAALSSLIVH